MSETSSAERSSRSIPREVAITRCPDDDDECLYIGTIGTESTQFRQRWETDDGEEEHRVYEIVAVVGLPSIMSTEEAVEWVESAPGTLTQHLEHELPGDIGEYPGIGLKESYTTEPESEVSQ